MLLKRRLNIKQTAQPKLFYRMGFCRPESTFNVIDQIFIAARLN